MPGRALPGPSPFAGDDGAADPRLAAALGEHARHAGQHDGRPASLEPVVAALAVARVLVPVLAEVEVAGSGADGLTVDKEASAGVVALRVADGRTALPVFTSVSSLAAWRADARPVPAEGPRAAASALAEGWELLVVDPAGPAPALIPRPAVHALATGRPWRPAVQDGLVQAEVRQAVAGALARVADVHGTDVVPGRRAEVAVVLALRPGMDRAALDRVVRAVGELLAADDVVTARVDSLELKVVTAS